MENKGCWVRGVPPGRAARAGSSFQAAEGISGRHGGSACISSVSQCLSFGNCGGSAGRNISVSHWERENWVRVKTQQILLSAQMGSLSYVASIALFELRWEVFLKLPIGACSQFLLVSDILKYLPAGSFILCFLIQAKLFLCFGVFLSRGGSWQGQVQMSQLHRRLRSQVGFPGLLLPQQWINFFLVVQGRFANSFWSISFMPLPFLSLIFEANKSLKGLFNR